MISLGDNRFFIKTDKYNWILIEKSLGKKDRHHYFANQKQLSRFIGELKLKEGLSKQSPQLIEISSRTPLYSSVIDEKIERLEDYIDQLINKDHEDSII
tara:strand:+ start:43 stop:339 length:297 start_codon:yes stop_codon:yes gene_type:complete